MKTRVRDRSLFITSVGTADKWLVKKFLGGQSWVTGN